MAEEPPDPHPITPEEWESFNRTTALLEEARLKSEADPKYQHERCVGRAFWRLRRCEELVELIKNGDMRYGDNRIAFALIMHGAVNLCCIPVRAIARQFGCSEARIRAYVSGEYGAGEVRFAPRVSNGKELLIEHIVLPLLEQRVQTLRRRSRARLEEFEVKYGMRPDPAVTDMTNVSVLTDHFLPK